MGKFKLYIHISPSWKFYVGITSLKNIEYRWGKEGNGYKAQYFKRAIDKYGWDNFIHIIVLDNLSKNDACKLEKIFIEQLKSNLPEYGYNISDGGDCTMLGKHHSQEAKQKISDRFSEPVDQYNKNGLLIKSWNSMIDAERELNMDRSSIAKCCKGIYKTSKGFVWRYKGEDFNKYSIKKYQQPLRRKKIKQFTKDGELIKIWDSIIEIQNETGIAASRICNCCKGKKKCKTAGGFVWRYQEDDFFKYNISNDKLRKVAKLENGEIKEVYESLAEAGRENGINPNYICMCCKGYIKNAGGTQWNYI